MADTSTETKEEEFAKLTTVKITHKFGDLEITHTYLVENDETYIRLDEYKKALDGKDTDYFSRHYFEIEKELGLIYQDTVDEKGKIVAAVITNKKGGDFVYEHYNKGEKYNFLELAQQYRTDSAGKIIWAWDRDQGDIFSEAQLAAFNAHYLFYKNKDLSVQSAKDNLEVSDFSNEEFDQAVKIANACKPE